jgi:hypothetical protein
MKNIIFGQVRHMLTAFGGTLVTAGYFSSSDLETVIGAVMIGAGMLWSFAEKKISGGK